ncbi:RING/U-box [Glarea lozoyensis ATCC 20868]|uniref:RING-type E3 ubiquitin transferase n=1 Tax=Glarea lozoyensis (strain ATCC 20868 / MF5171) TaxID=1116229 RepID=S3ECK9_GLAL2|nr:RING/U-box [Glarea lozoyensis ATCC 20868]EPE36043.1 RING/U-box [Glarea lozoyensis ATCC 20868]
MPSPYAAPTAYISGDDHLDGDELNINDINLNDDSSNRDPQAYEGAIDEIHQEDPALPLIEETNVTSHERILFHPPTTCSKNDEIPALSPSREPDLNCPICHDDYDNKSLVEPCLHTFCLACLKESVKISIETTQVPICPHCRQSIIVIYHSMLEDGQATKEKIISPTEMEFQETVDLLNDRRPDIRQAIEDRQEISERIESEEGSSLSAADMASRLENVTQKASEIASDVASRYSYETPLNAPPVEIILEFYDIVMSLIRAAKTEQQMITVKPVLIRVNGQIRRMEDCVVEHRWPDSYWRAHGLRYLSRPVELVILPTSLLEDKPRGTRGELLSINDILKDYFAGERESCGWEEQRLGTLTELSFPFNTSMIPTNVEEELVINFPHAALSEELNCFARRSVDRMEQIDGFFHIIIDGNSVLTRPIDGIQGPDRQALNKWLEWNDEFLKMLEVLRPAAHKSDEVASVLNPVIRRVNRRKRLLWLIYREADYS